VAKAVQEMPPASPETDFSGFAGEFSGMLWTSRTAAEHLPERNERSPAYKPKEDRMTLEQEDVKDLVLDLEQRIDIMQNMGDGELGTFTRLDWLILILFAIVIPVIAMVAAR